MEELRNSIVHEYSILYSNRIIQKDKKWNDGKLKYYEFNNKLEIFNEDGHLIEVDFINEKFKQNLAEQNEFKLPNNRLLIEIDCKLASYVRDVSELFKRPGKEAALPPSTKSETIGISRIKYEPIEVKQERIIKPIKYRPLKHEPFKKLLNDQTKVKQEPQPGIKQELVSKLPHLPSPPPIIKQEPENQILKETPHSQTVNAPNQNPRTQQEQQRAVPRIHPKSSRIFKHLSINKPLSTSFIGS